MKAKSVLFMVFITTIILLIPVAYANSVPSLTAAKAASAAPLPQLQFNESQEAVAVTNEISPGKSTSINHGLVLTGSQNEEKMTVPIGVIIYHANDTTTIFNQEGLQLFTADDDQSESIQTIKGDLPATFVHEIPNNSVIITDGDTLSVINNDARILTVINANSDAQINPSSGFYPICIGSPYPSKWIEGTEGKVTSTAGVYQFKADWNIPEKPLNSTDELTVHYPVFSWIGLYYCSNTIPNRTSFIQPVLSWNYPQNNTWNMFTWYLWTNSTTGLDNPDEYYDEFISGSQISTGDTVEGNIMINVYGYDAIGSITDLSPDSGVAAATYLYNNDPEWDTSRPVYAQIVYEGGGVKGTTIKQTHPENYTTPVTFNNFVLKDENGNSLLSSTSMSSFKNSQWYQNFTVYNNLTVYNRWPTDVTLVNNPYRVNRPVADFSASSLYGMGVLYVPFVDTSTGNPFLWLWDFGDSSNSTEQNPLHYYISPGTYTVNLTVWNAGGNNSSVRSNYITVYTPLIPIFHVNTNSGTAPLTVQFNDTSTGNATTWNWSFGDGNTSTLRNVSHTYTSNGIYNATLTIGNAVGTNTSAPQTITVSSPPASIGVFRSSTGYWYLDTNLDGTVDRSVHFGTNGDTPVVGDFNGDGTTDIGVFRNSTGYWYLDTNFDGTADKSVHFGTSGDKPVVGNFNSDGTTDIGVFRPSTGYWYVDTNFDGTADKSVHFGNSSDTPVVGDFNGDGTTDIGVFRNSTGNWYLDTNFDGTADTTVHLGTSGDIPVVGDWNNAGHSEIGVFRPSTGYWYVDTNFDGTADKSVHFGNSSDTPVVGDFNGDKTTDLGVFRNSTAYWYLDTNFDGTADTTVHFGNSSDTPVIGNWV